jgi:hypothetical protein
MARLPHPNDKDYVAPIEKYTGATGVDEKGEYKIKSISEYRVCRCHPETCNHFDGMTWYTKEIKEYI